MDDYESLSHTTWTCKYHVVFIPKGRRKVLYQELRRHLGEVFRKLALQRESKVGEGHLMHDHVDMLLSIPPNYGASQGTGCCLSRRKSRCPGSSDTSKARARSSWPGVMQSASATSWANPSGPVGSS